MSKEGISSKSCYTKEKGNQIAIAYDQEANDWARKKWWII
jgi:hypothetical protein